MPSGGTFQETVIWTNPSPTSSFSRKAVDLSDNINNYDYVAIEFNYSTSSTTEELKSRSIMSVADFKKGGRDTSVSRNCMAFGIVNASNIPYTRQVQYISDTSIHFTDCTAMNTTSSANSNAIPLRVIGLKY